MDAEKALVDARPPATDPVTYLTIIEYNLSKTTLPILHDILQDEKLTRDIGWDLVQLLLPLLPASQACLDDVAKLGNPREVGLKVTEALRLLWVENDETGSEANGEDASSKADHIRREDLGVLQFNVCLSMLSILYPRIRTKYPSRFLSTFLEAVLLACKRGVYQDANLTGSVLDFVRYATHDKRPPLPPRVSSGSVPVAQDANLTTGAGSEDTALSVDELALQKKLLQSFLTHLYETYLDSVTSDKDIPGMAWSSRLEEMLHKERIPLIPGRKALDGQFEEDAALRERRTITDRVLGQAVSLGLRPSILLKTLLSFEPESEEKADRGDGDEDDPPSSAEDVPYSPWGSLQIFAAQEAGKLETARSTSYSSLSLFPDHARVVKAYLSSPVGHSEAAIDAVLFLGLLALESGNIGTYSTDEEFTNYLLRISYLAANTPSPRLRYQALKLTSAVLHSNPAESMRFNYIKDTLEHCPYDNLRVSAVGWLKDEIILASRKKQDVSGEVRDDNVFSSPAVLNLLHELIFPDLIQDLSISTPLADAWASFDKNVSYYLASMAFYLFLLRASRLHTAMDIEAFRKTSGVYERYLVPLKAAAYRFDKALDQGELELDSEEEPGRCKGEIQLVLESLEQIEETSTALDTGT